MKGLAGLDLRVSEIEQRLIDRERRLLDSVRRLRLRVAIEPRRLLGLLVAAVPAAGAVFLMARKRRAPQLGRSKAATGRGTSLMRYIGLAWPLLPAAWRSQISPSTALPLIGLIGPLIDQIFTASTPLPPLNRVPQVDLSRYAGHWNEIAHLPAVSGTECQTQRAIEYRIRPQRADGSGMPRFDVFTRCTSKKGQTRQARGVAVSVAGSGGACLRVSFWPAWLRWLPGAWEEHCILQLDDQYIEALVGDAQRRYLVVLSRGATLATDRLEALLLQAQQQGFDVSRLVFPHR